MHCPSCGQHQASNTEHLRPLPLWNTGDGKRFCSHCGFPMELVAELIDHGGYLPKLAEIEQKKAIFTRKTGVVFSVFWMIVLMVLIPAIIGIANGTDEAMAISAVIGLFGGLMIMIGSLILLPSSGQHSLINARQMRSPPATTGGLDGGQHQALPPQRSIPVAVHVPPRTGLWRDTNDLEPSSFTESTTRPLEKEDERPLTTDRFM